MIPPSATSSRTLGQVTPATGECPLLRKDDRFSPVLSSLGHFTDGGAAGDGLAGAAQLGPLQSQHPRAPE